MTATSFDPIKDSISVTALAAEHLANTAAKQPDKFIRLATKEAGCSGFAYTLDFVDTIEDSDILAEPSPGLIVAIAADTLPLIKGTELDIEIFGLNKTIKYNNPNITGECGCGESFSVS